jgi:DNA repair protein RecO (recombination protein O)
MPSYRAQALVLRKTKLGETDSILTLLAEDGRELRAVAKGHRKPGSRLGGVLEPFTEASLLLHTGRSLDIVSEAQVIDAHSAIREDFDRLSMASAVADVLDKLSVEGQPEERLYGLGQATLQVVEDAEPDSLPQLLAAFLIKALAMHGYRPELESCAACASDVTGGRLFSLESGGVLCPDCGEGDASVTRFSEQARQLVHVLLGTRMADVVELDIPADTVRETLHLVRDFAAYHVPARIKALDMYVAAMDG